MNDEGDLTREIVEGLSVPSRRDDFVARVQGGAKVAERREVQRWKRRSYVLLGITVASLATTGALVAAPATTSGTVDFTVTCPSELRGDRTVINLGANPTGPPEVQNGQVVKPPPGFHAPLSLEVATADTIPVLTFSSGSGGYQLDRRRCTPTKHKLAFSHIGLKAQGTYTRGEYLNFGARCIGVGRVVFRARIESDDATGVPVHAQVLVIRFKTNRPLLYVDWTQDVVHGWALKSCEKWQFLS